MSSSKLNDLTGQKSSKKVKSFFDLVKDDSKLTGVVEAVLSGSLYKVRLDKQNCYVLLSVAGVRTLLSDKNIEQYDQYSKQSLKFAKENILQRDINIEPINCTPKGVIQANIFVNKINFGLSLIEIGLGFIDSKTANRYASEFKTAEEKAKAQKIGIWNANIQLNRGEKSAGFKVINETKNVIVSEIHDATEFYVQYSDSKVLDTIAKELESFKDSEPKLELPIKVGTPCVAKFSEDNQWYRVRIVKQISDKKFGVQFVDFGNYDEVDSNSLRKIPASLLNHEDQSKKCSLAFLRVPSYDLESGEKAANVLRDLTWEKKLTASFVYEDSKRRYCILNEKGSTDPKKSVNFALLSKGLAKIDRVVELPQAIGKVWTEEEEVISNKVVGVWATNELSDEEEDY